MKLDCCLGINDYLFFVQLVFSMGIYRLWVRDHGLGFDVVF